MGVGPKMKFSKNGFTARSENVIYSDSMFNSINRRLPNAPMHLK